MTFSKDLYTSLYSTINHLPKVPDRIAVAVSGGRDSSILAVVTKSVAYDMGIDLIFFHINHGLNSNANSWEKQVQKLGQILRIPTYGRTVSIHKNSGFGLESEARKERYKAFIELSKKFRIEHILLAHHQRDQAETVLMRLLRGTGLQGIRGMSPISKRDGLIYIRPWLNIGYTVIKDAANEFIKHQEWSVVDDPSNYDLRYTRSALRVVLGPILERKWPGWQKTLSRHAKHMSEIHEFLKEYARLDLNKLDLSSDGRNFSLSELRRLSPSRQSQVVRHWLDINHVPMPSEKRMENLLRQLGRLHNLGFDRNMSVRHGKYRIFCWKGRVYIDDNIF